MRQVHISNLNCNHLTWSYRIYLWLLSWIDFLWGQLWHLRELSEDAWSHVFPVKIRNRTGDNQTFLSFVHVPSHSDPPLLFLKFLKIHSRVDKSLWIYSCRESSCDSEYLLRSFLCTCTWNTIPAFLSDEHIWCESSVLMVLGMATLHRSHWCFFWWTLTWSFNNWALLKFFPHSLQGKYSSRAPTPFLWKCALACGMN